MTDHDDDKDSMHSSGSLRGLALLERDVAVMELEIVLSSGASVLDPIMAVHSGVDAVDAGGLLESELDKIYEDELEMIDVDDADMLDTDDLEDRKMLDTDDDEGAEQHDAASIVSHNSQEDISTLFSGNVATDNAHRLDDGVLSPPPSPSHQLTMELSAAAKYPDDVYEEISAKETLLGTLKGRDTPVSSNARWALP